MKSKWPAILLLSLILIGTACLLGCSGVSSNRGTTVTNTGAAPATVAYMYRGYPNTGANQIVGYSPIPGNSGAVISSFTQTPTFDMGGPIATDQTGQVYVYFVPIPDNGTVSILVYPPYPTGATGPLRSIQIPVGAYPEFNIFGLVVDSTGLLYIGYTTGPGLPTVAVYSATASGLATPIRTVQLANVQVATFPPLTDMALDANGNIYVAGNTTIAQTNASYIWVYPPATSGLVMPSRTLSLGGKDISGVAVDSKGDVFVNLWLPAVNNGSDDCVEEFAPGAEGAAAPINSINITAPSTYGIVYGGPVRLDGAGNIFSSFEIDPGSGDASLINWVIYGYEPTATGNQAPSVQIVPTPTDQQQPKFALQ